MSITRGGRSPFTWLIVAACSLLLWGCGSDDLVQSTPPEAVVDPGPIPATVPKAKCGATDAIESGLQGQVPLALRTPGGFKGFNCNLQLVGQSRNDGGSWQFAWFVDKAGHQCAYYDTSSATVNRTQTGVVVVDATTAASPKMTMSLTSTSMIDPWESLKVNERRSMLGAVNSLNGNGGPQIDLYDISGDCRFPQQLTGDSVGLDDGTGQFVAAVRGHEGNFAPDGLTYYGANLGAGYIYPIDIANPTKPKMLTQYFTAPGRVHGLAMNDAGTRGYVAIAGQGDAARAAGVDQNNGLLIIDTSEIQARKAGGVIKAISVVTWGDGSTAQHTIPITGINGKQYVISVDEGGGGGGNAAGWAAACAAGLAPWPMARIVDINDETKPKVISKLALEIHNAANCDKVTPDLVGTGVSGFTYGAHYCSVDNKKFATTLACGYFESGIRVFDIRNPERPKEIAYFNPPSVTTISPGSQNTRTTVIGRPDHCSAQLRLDVATGTLQTHCQDNGYMLLKFTNGAWPLPESSTPPGLQN